MKNKSVRIYKKDEAVFKEKLALFHYQLDKMNEDENYCYYLLTPAEGFNPDNLYFEKEVMKEFKTPLPFFPFFIFVGLAFILVTLYLVLALTAFKGQQNIGLMVGLFLPSSLCLFSATLYTYFRSKSFYLSSDTKIYSVEEIKQRIK